MSIGPDTRVYISVSASPGRFGATVYGALFERYGIDAVYLPRPAPSDARSIPDAVRALGISGCSVSSPHKRGVIEHLDVVDDGARAAQSVNTIVRSVAGVLTGYSTDVEGVVGALAGVSVESALIYGAGGVVGPTIVALRRLGAQRITMCSRSAGKAADVSERFGVDHASTTEACSMRHDLLVNATPAGRTSEGAQEVERLLASAGALLDMPVAAQPTYLYECAKRRGLEVRDGVEMCVHQIAAQSALYLGRQVSLDVVREIVQTGYLSQLGTSG